MVKSETRRDAEILVRNPSPRLFGEKFRDSKKVKANHEKTRLRDLSKTLPRFRDPTKIFRDPRFSRYTIRHPLKRLTGHNTRKRKINESDIKSHNNVYLSVCKSAVCVCPHRVDMSTMRTPGFFLTFSFRNENKMFANGLAFSEPSAIFIFLFMLSEKKDD